MLEISGENSPPSGLRTRRVVSFRSPLCGLQSGFPTQPFRGAEQKQKARCDGEPSQRALGIKL